MNSPVRKGVANVSHTLIGPFGVIIESGSGQILASGFTSNPNELVKMVPDVELTGAAGQEVELTSQAVDKFLHSYFSASPGNALANLDLCREGTDFQRAVWSEICKIPFASTASYKEMAHRVGKPNSHRATGSACGANRIALFIPCHRVVKTSGNAGEYRWGSELKTRLLNYERSISN